MVPTPQVTLKARLALRELLWQIRLEPRADGSLWAAYEVQPAVLVRAAVSGYAGWPICHCSGNPSK